jgi:anti-sigma regulatory factor (Ser/Thr protein kinase)
LTHRFPTEVHRVGELVNILLEARELDPNDAQELGLALRELLLNAMEHGNLEISFEAKSNALRQGSWKRMIAERSASAPYRSRETQVTAHWATDCVAFTIADEGRGFDWRALPDPTDPDNLLLDNGRGVLLARLSVDSLTYNEAGNEVSILKRLR